MISHTILTHNRERDHLLADGIIVTPSHNPPAEGGFKYNPPNGGPADPSITSWIESKANEYIINKLSGVKRVPYEKAMNSTLVHRYNYLKAYIQDLVNVVDMQMIHDAQVKIAVDPLGVQVFIIGDQ